MDPTQFSSSTSRKSRAQKTRSPIRVRTKASSVRSTNANSAASCSSNPGAFWFSRTRSITTICIPFQRSKRTWCAITSATWPIARFLTSLATDYNERRGSLWRFDTSQRQRGWSLNSSLRQQDSRQQRHHLHTQLDFEMNEGTMMEATSRSPIFWDLKEWKQSGELIFIHIWILSTM